jgi:hypothetical protein
MPWIRVATLLLISVLYACSYAFSDKPNCLERSIPVSLSDSNGAPNANLSASNLRGIYQKKPAVIESVRLEERPPRVVLLVDTSASMQLVGSAEAKIAEGVLSKLSTDVEVGLAFFAEDTTPVAYPTKDHQRLMYALEALRKGYIYEKKRTAIWSAVRESIKMFGTPVMGDSVYLISDGGDNGSKVRESDMEQILGSSGIRLFALLVAQPPGIRSRMSESLTGPGNVLAAAHFTGGTMISNAELSGIAEGEVDLAEKDGKATQLGQDIDRQIGQLLKFYRVEVRLPEPVDKPRNWKLELIGLGKFPGGKLELIYPNVLLPCP